jgi:hypothetical protein
MDKNNLVDFYYGFVAGEIPDDNDSYIKTKLLFDYLKECGCTLDDLYLCIITKFPNKEVLTPDDLPDILWDGSLLKRNSFYFHKELQVLSPPPTWDEVFPFYIEMKIMYSIGDILNFFIKSFKLNEYWVSREKELGSIKYLLKDYKKYGYVEPVDFILHLIDYVSASNVKANSIYDLRDYEAEYSELFEKDILSSKAANKNQVIWRMDVCGM